MKSCLDGWTLDVDDVPFAVHAVRIVRQEEKMQKVLGIGGVFFRARDPEALARWYTDHLGIDIADAVWQQRGGPTVFCPFKRDTEYFGRPEQQWMINFRVADLDAMIAQLQSRGIDVETRPDEWDSEVGRFARIHDPEGNPIELWEPAAHASLGAGTD
jgi:glyoxylase I family protein